MDFSKLTMTTNNIADISDDQIRHYWLTVNKHWYLGIPTGLNHFYKNIEHNINPYKALGGNNDSLLFWKASTNKIQRIHSGLPRQITNRMRDLVNTGYNISILDSEGKEDLDIFIELNEILKDNNYSKQFEEGLATESWAGFTVFKISHDLSLTQYPILEQVDPLNVDITVKRNRIQSYIFSIVEEINDKTYYIDEIYDINGIRFKTYSEPEKKEENIIPNFDGFEDITLNLGFIPAFIKPNTAINATLDNNFFGESDYNNSHPLYDQLDETLSQRSKKIRFASPKRFMTDGLLPEDELGNVAQFDDFDSDFTVLSKDINEGKNLLLQHDSKIEADEYRMVEEQLKFEILSNAGLSRLTLGDTQASGLNNDGDTLREREKLSFRTAEAKRGLWKTFKENLFEKLYLYNQFMNSSTPEDVSFIVEFEPHDKEPFNKLVETYSLALASGLTSYRQALEVLNPSYSDIQIDELLVVVKTEQNIPIIENEVLSTDLQPREE